MRQGYEERALRRAVVRPLADERDDEALRRVEPPVLRVEDDPLLLLREDEALLRERDAVLRRRVERAPAGLR